MPDTKRVAIAGAGVAGLAAAWVLADEGFSVDVFEARKIAGGRASSYEVPGPDGSRVRVDNSQHILMRCCANLLDLLSRVGVADEIEFHSQFTFLEPGGRQSVLAAGALPAPLHFAGSFLRLPFLSLKDKLAIARGMMAIRRDFPRGIELDSITMAEWLRRNGQTADAMRYFWEPVLISAVNETLEVISAWQGVRVIYLGFVAGKRNYEMGVPKLLLGDLYCADRWEGHPRIRIHRGVAVEGFVHAGERVEGVLARGELVRADAVVSALPYERLRPLFPGLELSIEGFAHSPIAGIHLQFDRTVTTLPHAAMLGRTIQWFFADETGSAISVVVSVARALERMSKDAVVDLALRELAEFLPGVAEARCLSSHVIRETRATFVASKGFEARRPGPLTRYSNFFLAGEWTSTGWPSTMEGAVISGYRAAEFVCRRAGITRRFVIPDALGEIRTQQDSNHRVGASE